VLGLSLRNLYYKLEQIQGAASTAKDGTPPAS
jgi:hypothetical protein